MRLIDDFKEYAALLEGVTHDEIMIFLMKSKLSSISRMKYDEQIGETETLDQFFEF